ncbi:Crp/Fnr family transcriptional regulator [Methylobacterium oryzihabitans]|uniref:Crp/Fnr family transcriptional regulator n=1 Tax=Methylobacterium oryzihabitans TaxID=2499852 RepID=A0A3S2VIS0_9HYPH|nr:Crp/Fnr family transcriptional regulator [Methylobacterium oryzihabitans]RVU13871.1 Crp/Fnr family transcriptional regulator [Methylobacterium oryzihabitans]
MTAAANPPRDLARLLCANPFFASLGEEVVAALAGLCVTRSLEAGRTLFCQGDPGDALYAVRRGQVRIVAGTGDGRTTTLNLLGPGDVFGEVALLDGQPRTATAVAAEPTELFAILRRDLLGLIERRPGVAVHLIAVLCARIRWLSRRAEEAAFLSLEERLIRRLAGLREDYGCEIIASQEALARFVGASRESVNRQLQVWKREGLVALGRGRITILDADALTRRAKTGG